MSCGKYYSLDLMIPDELWREITGWQNGEGLLCGSCIINKIEKIKGFSAFELVEI